MWNIPPKTCLSWLQIASRWEKDLADLLTVDCIYLSHKCFTQQSMQPLRSCCRISATLYSLICCMMCPLSYFFLIILVFLSTDDPTEADLWVLNSCTVKNPAEDHFRNSIK